MQANVARAGERFDRQLLRVTEILRMHRGGVVAVGAALPEFWPQLESI
jgi:hypothetical protein